MDSNTVIVEVFLLATTQTSSSFNLVLSNLVPSGQTALGTITSTFNSGVTGVFGNVNRSFKIESNAKEIHFYIRNILLDLEFLNLIITI